MRGALGVLVLLSALGCGRGPRAPVLQDTPVYQNSHEGFRFLVPEGWKQTVRAELPSGKLTKDCLLVRYQAPDRAAQLDVSAADFPEDFDILASLQERSFGIGRWQVQENVSVDIGGRSGRRVTLTGGQGQAALVKEVTFFRRRERVDFFTALFPPADATARKQTRQAVDGIVWR